jgi:hypothetical protein
VKGLFKNIPAQGRFSDQTCGLRQYETVLPLSGDHLLQT